LHVGTDLKSGV